MSASSRHERFEEMVGAHQDDVLAYALRRVTHPEDAADVVAETLLVAWRRLDDVPPGPQARLWLFGVARRQLANQRRGELRRSRLAGRLRDELREGRSVATPDEQAFAVRAALEALHPDDREMLTLSV